MWRQIGCLPSCWITFSHVAGQSTWLWHCCITCSFSSSHGLWHVPCVCMSLSSASLAFGLHRKQHWLPAGIQDHSSLPLWCLVTESNPPLLQVGVHEYLTFHMSSMVGQSTKRIGPAGLTCSRSTNPSWAAYSVPSLDLMSTAWTAVPARVYPLLSVFLISA